MIKRYFLILIIINIIFPGARFKSLLLPGWGEISISEKSRGQKFLASDILLWLIVINGKNLSKHYESNYRSFASEHAGVNWARTDYLFAVDIGYYNELSIYNEYKQRERSQPMRTDPNGELIREYGYAIYPQNGDFDWKWDSVASRKSYLDMRILSANWDKYANFAVAGLVINRLISLIDVIYLEKTGKSSSFQSEIKSLSLNNIKFQLSMEF